jgi:hypothetical protein
MVLELALGMLFVRSGADMKAVVSDLETAFRAIHSSSSNNSNHAVLSSSSNSNSSQAPPPCPACVRVCTVALCMVVHGCPQHLGFNARFAAQVAETVLSACATATGCCCREADFAEVYRATLRAASVEPQHDGAAGRGSGGGRGGPGGGGGGGGGVPPPASAATTTATFGEGISLGCLSSLLRRANSATLNGLKSDLAMYAGRRIRSWRAWDGGVAGGGGVSDSSGGAGDGGSADDDDDTDNNDDDDDFEGVGGRHSSGSHSSGDASLRPEVLAAFVVRFDVPGWGGWIGHQLVDLMVERLGQAANVTDTTLKLVRPRARPLQMHLLRRLHSTLGHTTALAMAKKLGLENCSDCRRLLFGERQRTTTAAAASAAAAAAAAARWPTQTQVVVGLAPPLSAGAAVHTMDEAAMEEEVVRRWTAAAGAEARSAEQLVQFVAPVDWILVDSPTSVQCALTGEAGAGRDSGGGSGRRSFVGVCACEVWGDVADSAAAAAAASAVLCY